MKSAQPDRVIRYEVKLQRSVIVILAILAIGVCANAFGPVGEAHADDDDILYQIKRSQRSIESTIEDAESNIVNMIRYHAD